MRQEADTRRLGVALRRLWLNGRQARLASPALGAGSHAPEAGWRSTDGAGEIDPAGGRLLAFEPALDGTYWRDAPLAGRCCGMARAVA
jgi:hypothetical protein